MGINIDIKKGNFPELLEALATKCKTDDRAFLTRILETFGERAGDMYFLLNNEHWDEFNSYYELANFLDRYYGIDDSFDVIVNLLEDVFANNNADEVADQLGIELPEGENE